MVFCEIFTTYTLILESRHGSLRIFSRPKSKKSALGADWGMCGLFRAPERRKSEKTSAGHLWQNNHFQLWVSSGLVWEQFEML